MCQVFYYYIIHYNIIHNCHHIIIIDISITVRNVWKFTKFIRYKCNVKFDDICGVFE